MAKKLIALTVRKLKPGSYDDWRRAWEGDRSLWPQIPIHAYILRNREDEDEIIAFGVVEGEPEELERVFADESVGAHEAERQEAMASFVQAVGADGVYEVIDEVEHQPATG